MNYEQKHKEMSLDEAIEHCKEKSCGNNACALEHKQLEKWLTELKELKELNPSWSEEDEKLYTSALWHIKNSCGNGGKDSGEYEVYNWLKSIKDRVQHPRKGLWDAEKTIEWIALHAELYGGFNQDKLNLMCEDLRKAMEE